MDPTKPSLSSKAPNANNGGANDPVMEETVQRDSESRESDVNVSATAETNQPHRGSEGRQKYSTIGHQRRTKQKVVTDFATISKGSSTGNKPRTALRQVLFSQGVSDKASEERGQLDMLKQELENITVPTSLKWTWKEDSQGSTLETSWTDIVQSHSTMPKMQRRQQEALWEFVTTELTYINKLIIIKDLVMAALSYLRQHGYLTEVTPEILFSNLPLILNAHQLFWQEVIYPMLHEVRKTGKPFDPIDLEAGCMQFQERFSCYKDYCWEEEDSVEFCWKQTESNSQFLTFVQWVENHPQCMRMRLGDMQAKPHQRITKYPLLLKAVLTNTQDTDVQLRLRGMHVRELCQFNLTCPIKGVDTKVIRKLLLEENLKVRGRRDNKLEVVALLFSDVLLITKVQKKGERLKVVRPPLALDRTYCIPLKDGYSFVLVEIGELQSVMNVFIIVASSPESCSMWVSTLHRAKETLKKLRLMEYHRQLSSKGHQDANKQEDTVNDTELEERSITHPRRESVVSDFTSVPHSMNGFNKAEQYVSQVKAASNNKGLEWDSQPSVQNQKVLHGSNTSQQLEPERCEWIEMKGYQSMNHMEEDEGKVVESKITFEGGLTLNHRTNSPNLDLFNQRTADPVKHNTRIPKLVAELPDVDYPMEDDSTLQHRDQPKTLKEGPAFVGQRQPEKSTKKNSDFHFMNQGILMNSGSSHSGKYNLLPNTFNFPKNLKSPGLRKRRPAATYQGPQLQQPSSHGLERSWSSSQNLSSDSESNISLERNSVSSNSSSESHRVFTLSSLKPNQGMFGKMSLSESEVSDGSPSNKRPNLKTQRSTSNPNINLEGVNINPLQTPHKDNEQRPHISRNNSSPLLGLLERAKERTSTRNMSKRVQIPTASDVVSRVPPPSPSFATTLSPPLSEQQLDRDLEEAPVLMRRRARAVSNGWKEQHVDGDENDGKKRNEFQEGENVDWTGWCFDDDEVMDHIQPRGEGLLVGISRSLASIGFNEFSEQDDGEYSQV
uniref:DH domain-containing protein n=1 Tax=Gouania willdenowi TaxID=441366 RepID=A0A8C5NGE7_GOUWI